jgi:hypothetical protein
VEIIPYTNLGSEFMDKKKKNNTEDIELDPEYIIISGKKRFEAIKKINEELYK